MHLLTASDPALLRAEVAALREREQRRVFPAHLAVGATAGAGPGWVLAWPPRALPDVGLLFDVLDGLHDAWESTDGRYDAWSRCQPSRVWVVRPGAPEVHDLDLRVASVARRVAASRGTDGLAPTVVLTRYGWLEPLSGASRRWKRLRVRPTAATG